MCVCVCVCARASAFLSVCVTVTWYGESVVPSVQIVEAGTDAKLPRLVLTLLVIVKVENPLKRGLPSKDNNC